MSLWCENSRCAALEQDGVSFETTGNEMTRAQTITECAFVIFLSPFSLLIFAKTRRN